MFTSYTLSVSKLDSSNTLTFQLGHCLQQGFGAKLTEKMMSTRIRRPQDPLRVCIIATFKMTVSSFISKVDAGACNRD